MNSFSIQFFMDFFVELYPSLASKVRLTNSIEGREISAIRIRARSEENPSERRGVLLIGGIHARELLNPDMLIELGAKLMTAYDREIDIEFGGRIWTFNEIRVMLEVLDIFILPNANPDGREFALHTNRLWRKNRRDNPGTTCKGVDLNRNFDFLWGIETVTMSGYPVTSRSPCNDTFVGSGSFSEPETQNVKRLLDDYNIRCMVDVHSYSDEILHPWGHAPIQTTDSTQRFHLADTSGWNRLPADAPNYEEYMPKSDLRRFQRTAQNAAEAIFDTHGNTYGVDPSIGLYPTTGTSTAYAYSRHIVDSGQRKVYGFTFETGPWTGSALNSFQPVEPALTRIKEEASSGLLSIIQQCICAIELVGSSLFGGEVDALAAMRGVRELRLARSVFGEAWIDLVERNQVEIAALVLGDDDLFSDARDLIVRVGELLKDDEVIDDDSVACATALIEKVGAMVCSPSLQDDIVMVKAQLHAIKGRCASDIIADLENQRPGDISFAE